MPDKSDFQALQYAFAAHIRDPQNVAAPKGIEDRRMAVYRKLFFNNLNNLLGTMFPVLRKIHSDDHWRRMIRQFMQEHRAETPYFLQLPEEFLGFLETEFEPGPQDHAFLLELAHYEYAELALSISTEQNDPASIDPDGDLLEETPVKSVLAWTYAYRYPVHRISPEFLPAEPAEQPVYLALYRDNYDKVHFLELNAVTAGLLDAIENNPDAQSGERLLRELAKKIHYPDVDALIGHGADALQQMRQLEILIGTRSAG
jgi:hypothetical protein